MGRTEVMKSLMRERRRESKPPERRRASASCCGVEIVASTAWKEGVAEPEAITRERRSMCAGSWRVEVLLNCTHGVVRKAGEAGESGVLLRALGRRGRWIRSDVRWLFSSQTLPQTRANDAP